MQLFFSYGHDKNVPVVEVLKRDLEGEGFKVWVDSYNLKSGDDWRREITRAILESDTAFSFASAYSLRHPGVCIDELSIAVGVKGALVQTILLEPRVQPPASTTFKNTIDMSDWLEHVGDTAFLAWHSKWCERLESSTGPTRSEIFGEYVSRSVVETLRGDVTFKAWYQPLLIQVLEILRDPKVAEYADEIRRLRDIMSPDELNTKQRVLEHEEYSGRGWLRSMLDEWMIDTTAPKVLLITGDPGVGKSSFVAHELLFNASVGAAVYCEWNNPASNSCERVAMSIAYQLACRYPDYRLLLMEALHIHSAKGEPELRRSKESAFEQYVVEPLARLIDGNRPHTLILIDGIDELEHAGHRTREGEALPSKISTYARLLPPWIRFVVTCRNTSSALNYLRDSLRINIDHAGKANISDVREYIALRLNGLVGEDGIGRMLVASDGVFLHAALLCDEIEHGWITADDMPDVPQSLAEVYRRYFDRMFSDANDLGYDGVESRGIFEALSALVACAQPIPMSTLRIAAGWGDPELSSFLKRCGHFLREANGMVTFAHKSLADWLQSSMAEYYQIDKGVGWRALAKACYTAYDNGLSRMNDFELLNLIGFVDEARMAYPVGTEDRELFKHMLDTVLVDRRLGAKLLGSGENFLSKRRYALAESCAKDAIRVYGALTQLDTGVGNAADVQGLADGYALLAEAVNLSVRFEEAIECCEDGIEALLDLRNSVCEVDAVVAKGIGRLHMKRSYVFYRMGGHPAEVEDGFQEACKWFLNAGYAYGAAEANLRLGTSYRLAGNHERALECARQVEEIIDLDECKLENPAFYCYIRTFQGDFHVNAGEFDSAERCLLDAKQVADQLGTNLPTARRAQLHMQLSSLYYQLGKYDLGERYGRESLRLQEEAYGKGSVESCNGMNQVGWCLLRQDGKAKEALELFEESYRIRNRLYGDTNPFTSVSLRNCAIAHMEMGGGWLDVAEEELERVLAARKVLYADRPDQRGRIAETLLDLGRLHLRTMRADRGEAALACICGAEEIYRALPGNSNTRSIASCLELRGDSLLLQGGESTSRACYEESLQLYRQAYGEDSDHHNIRRLLEKLRDS